MFERKFKNIEQLQNSSRKSYLKYSYPSSHWAKCIPQASDENFIAILEILGIKIALRLNATDARGYRSIARLIDDDMESTFNREYTETEKLALNIALSILSSIYERYGMAVQTEIAGNNSQCVTKEGKLLLGNEKEPSLLHGHIIARGNPATCYIAGVTLKGPEAGKLFNMRGDGTDEGNASKATWEEGEMNAVADKLASNLNELLDTCSSSIYKNFATITMLRPSDETRRVNKR